MIQTLTVSRRVNDRNGNFGGVVVTSAGMDFCRKLFDSVRSQGGRSIAMVSDDGTLLAASPATFGDGKLAALTAARDIEYRSPVDGVDRVGSFKHLAYYPAGSDDILRSIPLAANARPLMNP